MGLITIPTPGEQTAADIRAAITRLQQQQRFSRQQVGITLNRGAQLVWRNGRGLSPQQVFDSLGTDAAALLAFAADIRAFVAAHDPGNPIADPKPDGVTIAANADGTVTIAQQG